MIFSGAVHGGYGAHQKLGQNDELVLNETLRTFYKANLPGAVLVSLLSNRAYRLIGPFKFSQLSLLA